MKTIFILSFILLLLSFHSHAQQTIDKLNVNQLKLPKESANKALILDGAGQVKSSSTITDTELGYLEGLTDTLVNLLSGKANDADVVKLSGNQSVDGVKTFTGKLVASSTVNGSIPCPVMTETQRDAFTPIEGDCVYNSDTLKLNVFDGAVWKDVGGAGGISLWLTSNPYNVNDIIIESDKIYRCLIAHTSSVFATDLTAGNWIEVSSGLQSPVSLADGGTGVAITPTAGSIVYVDADSFEQVSGTAGQVLQSNGSGAPTFVNKSISAKSLYGSSVTAEEIQVPNNLLTQVDTNKHLNETGNKNILINPSFEHSTFSTGWTNSAGTFSEDTIVEIDGLKAAKLVLSSQTMSLSQSSTLYASQFADGVQGLASVRVKSDVALKVCSIQAGTVSTTNCVDVQANNKWGLYKVPMILGATSNGISIASSGSVSGTVYLDDSFVGVVDLQASVDSTKMAGEAYFAGTTSCNWSRTSTTIGAFTATAACPGPTIAYSSLGQWQTTDSDLPRVTVNNLPPGVYKATFFVTTSTGTNANAFLSINDGSTTCYAVGAEDSSATGSGQNVSCTFTYSNSGNRTFELYGASSTSSIIIYNSFTSPPKGTKFQLEYFGSSSVYSSTNADTDWNNISNVSAGTFITATTTNPTYGTVQVNKAQWKRQGSDLLLRWDYRQSTAGTAGSGIYLINIPQETGCTIDLSKAPASTPILASKLSDSKNSNVGTFYFADTNNDGVGQVFPYSSTQLAAAVIYSGSSPNRGWWGSGAGNAQFSTSAETFNLDARIPCANWQNSNIIIGQFNGLESCSNTLECTDTFSAKISSAGVTSDENVDFLNGNCTLASTTYTCNFKSGIFTVAPNCTVGVTGGLLNGANISTLSSTQLVYNTATSGANNVAAVNIICQKQGVDYIGKTAKAVASDQNLSAVGVTKGTMVSFAFAGVTEISGCSSSPCTLYDAVGVPAGFSVVRSATGTYDITFPSNFWSGTRYNCSTSTITFSGGEQGGFYRNAAKTNTTLRLIWRTAAGAFIDAAAAVVCFGERQ